MWSDTSRWARFYFATGALMHIVDPPLTPEVVMYTHYFLRFPPTALHRGGGGGEREGFLQADPLHRETKQRGEGAAALPGAGGCHSGRGAAGEDPEGGGGGQEGRRRAGEAVGHAGPHPLPSGTRQGREQEMWDDILRFKNKP